MQTNVVRSTRSREITIRNNLAVLIKGISVSVRQERSLKPQVVLIIDKRLLEAGVKHPEAGIAVDVGLSLLRRRTHIRIRWGQWRRSGRRIVVGAELANDYW